MNPALAIKDIMTKKVITAHPDEAIARVREKIRDHSIHHIPVVDNGKVLGMISLNDIHSMEHQFTRFNNPEAIDRNKQVFTTMLAKEVMTTPVVKVRETEPISHAVDLLLQNLFHALPVVDNNDQLVGMITTFDLIRHSVESGVRT